MKNIICLIARTNSTRLPHKTIKEIHGEKMIEIMIDSMKSVMSSDGVYVCTSEDETDRILVDIAREKGVKAVAGSRTAVISRMLTVADIEKCDNLVRVTGDNIFTDPRFLDFAIKTHNEKNADYTRVEYLPIGVTGEVMRVKALKDCYNSIDPDKSEYLFLYMFDPEKYRCVTIIPPQRYQNEYKTLTVDTVDDWERTNYIIDNIKRTNILYKDIVDLSERVQIPHYDITPEAGVKMPDDGVITFKEFRKMIAGRIEKSLVVNMEANDYEQ